MKKSSTEFLLNRRATLMTLGAAAATMAAPSWAKASPQVHVVKTPTCGCCHAWIEHLEQNGFAVTSEDTAGEVLARFKYDSGLPEAMFSCHTGQVDGYIIEGHVPAADIQRLLDERPDALGLAVPGMPMGSPGMDFGEGSEAYDVFLIGKDGSAEIFTSYAAT